MLLYRYRHCRIKIKCRRPMNSNKIFLFSFAKLPPHLCKTMFINNYSVLLCIVRLFFFIFFLGTLPSGAQLLHRVHPKRRKSKIKNNLVLSLIVPNSKSAEYCVSQI